MLPSLFLTLTSFVFAGGTVTTSLPDMYKTKVLSDLNSSQIVQSNIKNKMHSACPQAKSQDMSACFKIQLQPLDIKSTSQLAMLMGVASTAALIDQGNGYDATTSTLMALDSLLFIMEKMNLSKFHLNEFRVHSTSDYVTLVLLRQEDDKLFATLKTKMLTLIKTRMADVEAKLHMPNASSKPELQVWQNNQLQSLASRFSELQKKSLQYAPADMTFNKAAIAKYNRDEKKKALCFNSRISNCKQMSLDMCESLTTNAFSSCEKTVNARVPASLNKSQDITIYLKTLNACAGPLTQQAFQKAAPLCH